MVSKCFDALYSADTAKHIYAFLPSNDAAKKFKYKGNIYIAHQNQNHNPYEFFKIYLFFNSVCSPKVSNLSFGVKF